MSQSVDTVRSASGRRTVGARRVLAWSLFAGTLAFGAIAVWFYVLRLQPPRVTVEGRPLGSQKAVIDRANALLKENRAQESLELLKEMPAASDRWYRKHLQLGRAYDSLGDYDAAKGAFREALRLKSDSVEARVGLGIVLETEGTFSAAGEQYRKALELKPEAAMIHFRLGRSLESAGDRAGAIQAMQNAIRYQPDWLRVYQYLARLLREEGRADDAREVLQRALELAPDDRKTQAMLDRLVETPQERVPVASGNR